MTTAGDRDDLRIAHCTGTGRPVLVAPQRRHRPLLTHGGDEVAACPFCPGEEHQTPPEVDRVPDASGGGWRVRAFPNLYPASADHEVVVEGAAHETRPAAVPAPVWRSALVVYRRRIAALEARPGVRCVFLFKNVGREAGASIAHNHSQLLGVPMLPPRLELELAQARGSCPICAELESAPREGRVVVETEHHLAFCPSAPKLPHETWFAPKRHDGDFLAADDACDADFAEAFAAFLAAVDRGLDEPALNLYLHRVPAEPFHWHVELQPRTGYLAGLELGGDMYINSVPGAEAAARLRG